MPSSTEPPSRSHIHPDVPPFPSPSTFSILPDIYLLIARLNILQNPPPSQSLTQPNPSHPQSAPGGTQQSSQPASLSQVTRHIQTGPPIDAKELPTNVYPIKQKLAKARTAVSSLPDVDRTVQEQEAEIQELENTIRLLKARLARLGGIAASRGREDAVMQGVEG